MRVGAGPRRLRHDAVRYGRLGEELMGGPGLQRQREGGRRQRLPTRAGPAQEEKGEEGEKGRARGPAGTGLAGRK
jgi:hypothetical protein